MLRRTNVNGGQEVEFVVEAGTPASVVGDFNDWDPGRGVLAANGDEGAISWRTHLAPGRYAFRYLRDGEFFDDPQADAFEPNGYGQFHGVVIVDRPGPGIRSDQEPDARPVAPAAPAAPAAKKAPAKRTAKKPAARPAPDHDLIAAFERATARHPYLSGASVVISVEDRVIHLEGTVASSLAKQALWELAWGMRRVRDVRDDVVICST